MIIDIGDNLRLVFFVTAFLYVAASIAKGRRK